MRRKEREVTEKTAMERVIERSLVCRLGLSEDNRPYVVPLCFGYRDGALYFHSAREGKKLDIIRGNPNVCFEFDLDCEVVRAEKACDWGMKYRSVVGFGKAAVVHNPEEKKRALGIIAKQYAGQAHPFTENEVNRIAIIQVDIERMSGKQSGY